MVAFQRINDDEHGYAVEIPDATPRGQAVAVRSGERNGVHILHAESPDQSELYFEVTSYPALNDHGALARDQQRFLSEHAADAEMTAIERTVTLGQSGLTFDFSGTLQGRWKARRFLFLDGPTRTYRVVRDHTSELNERVLGSFNLRRERHD